MRFEELTHDEIIVARNELIFARAHLIDTAFGDHAEYNLNRAALLVPVIDYLDSLLDFDS